MLYRTLAPGVQMPALGLGTYKITGSAVQPALEYALEVGYRHIDTASIYGNEREIGRVLAASGIPRSELFITTKVWYEDLSTEAFRASVLRSLSALLVSEVDLLLIHWPNPAIPLDETLDALVEAKDMGFTRAVGVSNFPVPLFDRACERATISCNQVEYHPLLSQQHLLHRCTVQGAVLSAYRPAGNGIFTQHERLSAIGAPHGKSGVQVALRWLLQQENVAALPKSASPSHQRANFDVFDFALTDAEMHAISALANGTRMVNPPFAPQWDV